MGRARPAWSRRQQGLKKKASELSMLCGVDVCLLGRTPDGDIFFWPDDLGELRRIAERYVQAAPPGGDRQAPAKKRKRANDAAAGGPFPGSPSGPNKPERTNDAAAGAPFPGSPSGPNKPERTNDAAAGGPFPGSPSGPKTPKKASTSVAKNAAADSLTDEQPEANGGWSDPPVFSDDDDLHYLLNSPAAPPPLTQYLAPCLGGFFL